MNCLINQRSQINRYQPSLLQPQHEKKKQKFKKCKEYKKIKKNY